MPPSRCCSSTSRVFALSSEVLTSSTIIFATRSRIPSRVPASGWTPGGRAKAGPSSVEIQKLLWSKLFQSCKSPGISSPSWGTSTPARKLITIYWRTKPTRAFGISIRASSMGCHLAAWWNASFESIYWSSASCGNLVQTFKQSSSFAPWDNAAMVLFSTWLELGSGGLELLAGEEHVMWELLGVVLAASVSPFHYIEYDWKLAFLGSLLCCLFWGFVVCLVVAFLGCCFCLVCFPSFQSTLSHCSGCCNM